MTLCARLRYNETRWLQDWTITWFKQIRFWSLNDGRNNFHEHVRNMIRWVNSTWNSTFGRAWKSHSLWVASLATFHLQAENMFGTLQQWMSIDEINFKNLSACTTQNTGTHILVSCIGQSTVNHRVCHLSDNLFVDIAPEVVPLQCTDPNPKLQIPIPEKYMRSAYKNRPVLVRLNARNCCYGIFPIFAYQW